MAARPVRHNSPLLLAAGAAALAACPGSLDRPERFHRVSNVTCTLTLDVPMQIFGQRCATAGCHTAADRAGTLDLVSAGVRERLLGVESGTCAGQTRVLRDDPGSGFLIDKLRPSPTCGTQMPQGATALTEAEIDCVRAWLVGSPDGGAGDGGPMDAAADARGDVGGP